MFTTPSTFDGAEPATARPRGVPYFAKLCADDRTEPDRFIRWFLLPGETARRARPAAVAREAARVAALAHAVAARFWIACSFIRKSGTRCDACGEQLPSGKHFPHVSASDASWRLWFCRPCAAATGHPRFVAVASEPLKGRGHTTPALSAFGLDVRELRGSARA